MKKKKKVELLVCISRVIEEEEKLALALSFALSFPSSFSPSDAQICGCGTRGLSSCWPHCAKVQQSRAASSRGFFFFFSIVVVNVYIVVDLSQLALFRESQPPRPSAL